MAVNAEKPAATELAHPVEDEEAQESDQGDDADDGGDPGRLESENVGGVELQVLPDNDDVDHLLEQVVEQGIALTIAPFPVGQGVGWCPARLIFLFHVCSSSAKSRR